MAKTHKLFWLIAKPNRDKYLEIFVMKVAEQDIEGYINALRTKGYVSFEIASPEYGVENSGTVDAAKILTVDDEGTEV
jgi:hypothetical protein